MTTEGSTSQMNTQTDAEHIQEIRDSAAEAQSARNEVITEIARLTNALAAAEAERDAIQEHKRARDMEIAKQDSQIIKLQFELDNLQRFCATVQIQRDNAMAEMERIPQLIIERDAARADAVALERDAERLAYALTQIEISVRDGRVVLDVVCRRCDRDAEPHRLLCAECQARYGRTAYQRLQERKASGLEGKYRRT